MLCYGEQTVMTRPRTAPNCTCPRPWRLAVLAAVLSVTGCQWVFGDYASDPDFVLGCKDGETACVADSKQLNVCKDGEWVKSRDCAISCKRDRCIDCEGDVSRCSDDLSVLETCSNGAWSQQECAAAEYCGMLPGGLLACIQCERDTCSVKGDRAIVAVCSFDGKWALPLECAEAFNECRFASDGSPYCVDCATDGYSCTNEGNLLVCENGRSTAIRSCGAGNCDAQNARCIVEPQ